MGLHICYQNYCLREWPPYRTNYGCPRQSESSSNLCKWTIGIKRYKMTSVRLMSTAARYIRRPPWTPPHNLKYPLREIDPSILTPSNWAPPMGGFEKLPFRIFRTTKGKQLPVYTDYKNGRTRCLTLVRRFRGDVQELAHELSKVCDCREVTIRPGRVEVVGNYCGRVTEWLQRLGF